MPTTVTKTIGASGADYTTIALWEDGTDDTSLVTADEIRVGACKNETFSSSSTLATIAGATTDATRYRHLTTDTGASFRDNANVQTNALRYNASNGAAISSSASYSRAILIDENNCRLSKLQIQGTASSGRAIDILNSRTGIDVDGCILESGLSISGGGFTGKVRNSLIVSRVGGRARLFSVGSSTPDFINCTFATPSDLTKATAAFDGNYGTVTAKNCAFFGVNAVKAGTSGYTFTTCKTDDASPPSGCTTATYANQFQDAADATRDFRLKSGADCIDAGTTDSTNAATDIAGTARPSGAAYDVGAWEYVSTSGAALQGNAQALASATGALSTQIPLAGAAVVVATMNGALSTAIPLAGAAASVSVMNGVITTEIRLTAAALAVAAMGGELTTQIALSGAALAAVLMSGELAGNQLQGAASAQATATGALTTQIPLAGAASAQAGMAGGLTTAIPLLGAAASVTTGEGALLTEIRLSAAALAQALAAGGLTTQIPLEAAALVIAAASGSLTGTVERVIDPRFAVAANEREFSVHARANRFRVSA